VATAWAHRQAGDAHDHSAVEAAGSEGGLPGRSLGGRQLGGHWLVALGGALALWLALPPLALGQPAPPDEPPPDVVDEPPPEEAPPEEAPLEEAPPEAVPPAEAPPPVAPAEPKPTAPAAAEDTAAITTQPGDVSVVDDSDVEQPAGHTPSFLRALRLGGDSLVLGAYLQPGFVYQADTEFWEDDTDGFDFANARLTGAGQMPIYEELLHLRLRFNFDVNQGNFAVRDVYGGLALRWDDDAQTVKGGFGFDVGQLKQPFGLALLQSEAKMQFPYSSPIRILAFGRDLGAKVYGDLDVSNVWMRLSAMVSNGEGGFRQRRNFDDEYVFTSRFEIAPLGKMEMSEPDLKESPLRLTAGFNIGYATALGKGLSLADVGASELRYGGDLRVHFAGASLRGEVLRGERDENEGEPGFGRLGVSVQGGYVLPIPIAMPQFELVFRYAQWDVNDELDGTEGDDYVVDNTAIRYLEPGLNIYLFEHAAKLHLAYRLTDLLEGPKTDVNGDVLIGDAFYTFFQFAWL